MRSNPLFLFIVGLLTTCALGGVEPTFRPPAVPLVAHDPYFSIWSPADRLTDGWSTHWTGAVQAMVGLIRVDEKPYRFMGLQPDNAPAMKQVGLEVWPTRTVYRFEAAGVALDVTFLSPLLPRDLDVLGRSVTYITCQVRGTDDRPHHVALYFECTGELAVNSADQPVNWSRFNIDGMSALRIGTQEQPVLAKRGDNLRLDWGYVYLAVPPQERAATVISAEGASRREFAASGRIQNTDDLHMPRPANERWPGLVAAFDLGEIGNRPVSRHVLLACDDVYSIELFGRRLRPYWRRHGKDAGALLAAAERDYPALVKRCQAFDEDLMADLSRVGGKQYAQLCALAYRQCLAANKLAADWDGTPLLFPKENFSNGCISTVDVIYPACPLFLLLNNQLMEAQLKPVMDYAASARWKWPFAPHDLGTYPLANGQVYGGGERTEENQMPVEESGNMLLMLAAMAKSDGRPEFAARYWPTLEKWAQYLRDKGLDPENQLCTDDFAGHLAHNANLSIKAILALGAYAQLCEKLGETAEASEYLQLARKMAAQWVEMARDGDHYKLAFDKPGTWSQKYNLVWDRLLGLDIFPPEVAATEVAFYGGQMNEFGLPLDNRSKYTKSDWLVWTATLADSRKDFEVFIAPLYRFTCQTPDRVAFTDWYWTHDAKRVGFQARSVIGGVFMKALADAKLWRKWADMDR